MVTAFDDGGGRNESNFSFLLEFFDGQSTAVTHCMANFAQGKTNEEIMEIAMRDIPFDIFDTIEVGYKCDCSRKRMRDKILSLGKEEIKNMYNEQEAEGKPRELTAVCRFCNSEYTFVESDFFG